MNQLCCICNQPAEPESNELLGHWLCEEHCEPLVKSMTDGFTRVLTELKANQPNAAIQRLNDLLSSGV